MTRALVVAASSAAAARQGAWTLTGAQIADGTGGPIRRADLRVVGDTITEIGEVRRRPEDLIRDASGLVLAPGFIDAHNHSTEGLDSDPDAASQVSQGITTMLLGQELRDGAMGLSSGLEYDRPS